jgi:hypothetical protein
MLPLLADLIVSGDLSVTGGHIAEPPGLVPALTHAESVASWLFEDFAGV